MQLFHTLSVGVGNLTTNTFKVCQGQTTGHMTYFFRQNVGSLMWGTEPERMVGQTQCQWHLWHWCTIFHSLLRACLVLICAHWAALTWSLLLLLTAPGFFFFFRGLGEVSVGECPLEEWVGLDTFLFCGTTGLSADPGGSGTGCRRTNRSSHYRSRHVTQG